MDQLYKDFTDKLLPTIQSGLTITKDYFYDLFSRDIKYLLVTDSIWTIVGLIVAIIGLIFLIKGLTMKATGYQYSWETSPDWQGEKVFCVMAGACSLALGLLLFFLNLDSIVKDLYIPEVRVYEQIQSFKVSN